MSASSAANSVIAEDSAAEQEVVEVASRTTLRRSNFEKKRENLRRSNYNLRSYKKTNDNAVVEGPAEPTEPNRIETRATETIIKEESETLGVDYWKKQAEELQKKDLQKSNEISNLRILTTTLHGSLAPAQVAVGEISNAVKKLDEILKTAVAKQEDKEEVAKEASRMMGEVHNLNHQLGNLGSNEGCSYERLQNTVAVSEPTEPECIKTEANV